MIQDILTKKYEDVIEQLWLYEKNDVIKVSAIVIDPKKREMGYGTKIMKDIIEYADKNKMTVVLTPSSDFGGDKKRLTKFYKGFNFVPNRGANKDFRFSSTMLRLPENIESDNTDNVKGGLADNMNIKEIAKHHGVKLSDLMPEYKKGIQIEMEHTDKESVAREIARDHLFEDPKYYTKLAKIESHGYTEIIKKRLEQISNGKVDK
jgi:predicted GNAT family acetyltransferase